MAISPTIYLMYILCMYVLFSLMYVFVVTSSLGEVPYRPLYILISCCVFQHSVHLCLSQLKTKNKEFINSLIYFFYMYSTITIIEIWADINLASHFWIYVEKFMEENAFNGLSSVRPLHTIMR